MRHFICLIFLVSCSISFAQNHRFGRVSIEELEKTESKITPDAAAEILYEKANVSLELNTRGKFVLTREYEGRIKIYDKDNVDEDLLVLEVLFSSSSNSRESVSGLRGSTYNLENGKSVETRVRNSDIFSESINRYWNSQKFTFPNVQNGSVLEYKYTITSENFREIDRWFFQKEIPVIYNEFKFKHPDMFRFSPDIRGGISGRTIRGGEASHDYTFDYETTTFIYENLPALDREAFVFNLDNLKASIRFELMQFAHAGHMSENYATSWEQIGKDLMRHSNFGGQLAGNNFLNDPVQQIIANAETDEEKMERIFNYAKNNFSWNNFTGITTENGIRNTFNNKSGNVADINLLLVSMLQKAGLNASPVVSSTVSNLMLNYSFPSITSLNYVIAAVDIDNTTYLMDATERYSRINMLPMRALNHRGFKLISENQITETPLLNYAMSTSRKTALVNLNPDGTISGNFSENRDSYFAMNDKRRQTSNPKQFEERYLNNYNFDIDNFKIEENEERGMFRYSFQFENAPGGNVIGDKIIFNPLFFTQNKTPMFVSNNRNYPLEFGTLMALEKIFRIKIPEGYKVESLPESKTFVVEGNVAGYSYNVEQKDDMIIVSTLYQIGHSTLPFSFYEPMKEFELNEINAEAQQIVLVKQ